MDDHQLFHVGCGHFSQTMMGGDYPWVGHLCPTCHAAKLAELEHPPPHAEDVSQLAPPVDSVRALAATCVHVRGEVSSRTRWYGGKHTGGGYVHHGYIVP